MIYDVFLLFGLLMLYGAFVLVVESFLSGQQSIVQSRTAGGNPLVFAGMLGVIGSFYCIFWLKSGQTLGMQAWRLKIETIDGSPLTLRHCLMRLMSAILSIVMFGMGYWWCLLPGKQTWHDKWSGTKTTVHEKRL
jgi:uncharacterized RDD family membrane protein YckC